MRRATILVTGLLALLVTAAAAPAFAGYGALARDEATGKFGLTWDKPSQSQAEELATKDCAESSCKIIFRTKSHQCGAIATAEKGTAWGAATRNHRDAAALAAMTDCQKHTPGQCKVRAAGCNH